VSKLKLILGLILFLSFITGCDVFKTEKDELLFYSIAELQNQIEQEEWDQVLSHISHFQEKYEQRKWKLQLLGELDDYKEIELEIGALKESVKEKDKLESMIALSEIRHRLLIIYSL
jgi:DNA polymerase III delta prime subunit